MPVTPLASETRRAYAADWAHFTAWCQDAGCAPLPAEPGAVAAYLVARDVLYSRAAIGHAHRLHGLAWSAKHPAICTALRGLHRCDGSQPRQASALTSAELRKLIAGRLWDRAGLRGRALELCPRKPDVTRGLRRD